jgi:hypothetical protein
MANGQDESPPPPPLSQAGLCGVGGALWRGGTSRNEAAEHTILQYALKLKLHIHTVKIYENLKKVIY